MQHLETLIEPNHLVGIAKEQNGSQMKEEVTLKHILSEARTTNRLLRKNNELLLRLIDQMKKRREF